MMEVHYTVVFQGLSEAIQDAEMAALRQRNERRAAKARAALGTRWLCHPANHVKRKPVDLGVIGGVR